MFSPRRRPVRKIKRLLSDYMLVKIDPIPEKTEGGIIRAGQLDRDKEPVRTGVVLMAGPGRRYIDKFTPMPDNILGMRVAFMIAASQTKGGRELRQTLQMDAEHEIIRLGDVLLDVDEGVEVSG
jgi:co-chaperonin GroES (HSP10)